MNFDRNSGQYSSTDDDILVSAPGFGDTNSVENLGQDVIPIPYFKDMVEYFVRRGYERGKNIRAAPYDWRLAPGKIIVINARKLSVMNGQSVHCHHEGLPILGYCLTILHLLQYNIAN